MCQTYRKTQQEKHPYGGKGADLGNIGHKCRSKVEATAHECFVLSMKVCDGDRFILVKPAMCWDRTVRSVCVGGMGP